MDLILCAAVHGEVKVNGLQVRSGLSMTGEGRPVGISSLEVARVAFLAKVPVQNRYEAIAEIPSSSIDIPMQMLIVKAMTSKSKKRLIETTFGRISRAC